MNPKRHKFSPHITRAGFSVDQFVGKKPIGHPHLRDRELKIWNIIYAHPDFRRSVVDYAQALIALEGGMSARFAIERTMAQFFAYGFRGIDLFNRGGEDYAIGRKHILEAGEALLKVEK